MIRKNRLMKSILKNSKPIFKQAQNPKPESLQSNVTVDECRSRHMLGTCHLQVMFGGCFLSSYNHYLNITDKVNKFSGSGSSYMRSIMRRGLDYCSLLLEPADFLSVDSLSSWVCNLTIMSTDFCFYSIAYICVKVIIWCSNSVWFGMQGNI